MFKEKPFGEKNPLCVAEETRIYDPTILDEEAMLVNTYHYGKAGYYNMTKMLQSATNSSCKAFIESLDDVKYIYSQMYEAWKTYGGNVEPLSWVEALQMKDKDTTNGYPLNYYETNDYASLIEMYGGYEELAEIMEELEKYLLSGGKLPPVCWRPFPKEDKYSTRKVLGNDLRMVSTGPLFLLVLCRRWFSLGMERLERMIKQAFLVTTSEQFQSKVYYRLSHRKSFGIDYSSYDKNTVAGSTYQSMELLWKLLNQSIPIEIFDYVAISVTQPLSVLVAPSGATDIYCLGGSNPSGQLFTSWCNTISHVSHNALFLYQTYRVNPVDYINDIAQLRSVATGDDGVETLPSCWSDEQVISFAESLAEFIYDKFSIPAKLDLMKSGDDTLPYPPEMLAPYLNNVMVEHETGKSYYLLPVHPERFLPSLLYYTGNDALKIDELSIARARGIYDQVKSIVFHEYINPDIPQNKVVKVILKMITQTGLKIPKPHETVFSKVLVNVIPEGQLVF